MNFARLFFLTPVIFSLFLLPGCHSGKTGVSAPPAPKKPAVRVSDADIQAFKPNEVGAIMVIMYHRIDKKRPNGPMNRTPDQFRKDLDSLYNSNYRPVNISDIIDNNMDVPGGKTPVAISFDDSWDSQFRVMVGKDGQTHIDPNCAVGIMETFNKTHPDWPNKATFFVLPQEAQIPPPFYQAEAVNDKLEYLTKHGYEIGNHTATHPGSMRTMPVEQVKWQIAQAIRDIRKINPDAQLQVLAVPYGNVPRQAAAKQALLSGTEGGTTYKNKAIVLAAWRPIMSPVAKAGKSIMPSGQIAAYNPYRIERVLPDPKQANKAGTLEYYLKFFKDNPTIRYVSDGNLNVVTVPASNQRLVDAAKVKAQGKTLQVYGGSGEPSATSHGGALNVE